MSPADATTTGSPVEPPGEAGTHGPHDLLDHVGAGDPALAGLFRLVPVRTEGDPPLLARWMNAPAVAEPDLRDVPSVTAFPRAGFRFSAGGGPPGERAAPTVRDRALRPLPQRSVTVLAHAAHRSCRRRTATGRRRPDPRSPRLDHIPRPHRGRPDVGAGP
ncbi:hypothetical protein GCM10019016_038950 [Streptomyces prasinosporus]|uniref:Uncharacterized protein n=1 Tax=Streptomyces prasinosporus TaxID=68256 RepID=A0ABP6TPU4_9ACTN